MTDAQLDRLEDFTQRMEDVALRSVYPVRPPRLTVNERHTDGETYGEVTP